MEYLREKKVIWRQRKKGLEDIYGEYGRLKRTHGKDFVAMTEGMKEWYRSLTDGHPAKAHKHYHQVDDRGIYFAADISWPGGGGPKYEVRHPVTGQPVKVPARGWITPDPNKMQKWIDDNRVHFGIDESSVPCLKKYLTDSEVQTPYSVFYQDGRAASKRLRALMGGDLFEFPKDEVVLQEIIEMLTSGEDIILDCFAGSSTTAHSVMLQNAADGHNRRFIMVQLDEETSEDSAAYKAGFKTISEVSRERIRRAGKAILTGENNAAWSKDVGFRSLKIDTSNMAEVYYTPTSVKQDDLLGQIDNVKSGRGQPEDLLFQVLIDWGGDLTASIRKESVKGKTVFFVNAEPYDLIACFDRGVSEDLVKELAKFKPVRIVFRDNGFESDALKINVEQIFRQLSPSTDVKAI
jgi:adenine-specific DNA-methyltransferase